PRGLGAASATYGRARHHRGRRVTVGHAGASISHRCPAPRDAHLVSFELAVYGRTGQCLSPIINDGLDDALWRSGSAHRGAAQPGGTEQPVEFCEGTTPTTEDGKHG